MLGDRIPAKVFSMRVIPSLDAGLKKRLQLDASFSSIGLITCDSDDVYPPKPSHSPLYLPVETDELYIGFFSIGAYQEMLGGVKGSKHCVLPEAMELVIDKDADGHYQFDLIHGQTEQEVMANLGYR